MQMREWMVMVVKLYTPLDSNADVPMEFENIRDMKIYLRQRIKKSRRGYFGHRREHSRNARRRRY